MVKKGYFSWGVLGFTKKEIFVGLILFITSGIFFRWLGSIVWRKPSKLLNDRVMILSPDINELTIQEFRMDMEILETRIDNLNNDFLINNKGLMENTEKFRGINKVYLELRLRLNHIIKELENKKNDKHKTDKIEEYEKLMTKMKDSLDLLSEELKRETDESQAGTLHMLTLVETIFLPLGVLTGYFGMNFSSMGGHVGDDHNPAPGVLGMRYGQGFVWAIMLVCVVMILYAFGYTDFEPFDISHKCNDTKKEIVPFNVTSEDLRKLNMDDGSNIPSIFELPYDTINFYRYS